MQDRSAEKSRCGIWKVALGITIVCFTLGFATEAAEDPLQHIADAACPPREGGSGHPRVCMKLLDEPWLAPVQPVPGELSASTWMRAMGGPANDFLVAAPLSDDGTITFAGIASITSESDFAWYGQMDSSGSTLWQKSFTDSAREQWTPAFDYDRGMVFKCLTTAQGAGGTDILLVKTGPAGDILWQETLGGPGDENGDIIPLQSGGYCLAAGTTSSGEGGWDLWMAKLSGNGAVLWQKTYGTPEDDRAYAGVYPDGSLFIAGLNATQNLWYFRTDAAGNIIWQKSISGLPYVPNISVSRTSDGNVLISLYGNEPGDGHLQLIKVGSSGEILWQKMYICYDLNLLTVRSSSGNNILLAGVVSLNFEDKAVWLVMLDASGEVLWQKAYASGQNQNASQVYTFPMADGSTAFTCTFTIGNPTGTWVADIGNQGQIVWQKFYGSGEHMDATSIPVPTADGGLILSGTTQSWGSGQADGWVFKTTSTGEMDPSCTGVRNATCTTSVRELYVVPTTLSAGQGIIIAKTPSFAPAHTSLVAANASYTNTLVCSGGGSTCSIACTATVPAGGTVGTPVSFSATATPTNCTESVTYAWVFGDGNTSSQQNPSHTYASAGTFNWTMTASVAGVTCPKSGTITITGGSTCTLTCSATVPPTGQPGTPVAFAGSATATNCQGQVSYQWNFGDGHIVNEQNPSHTYSQAGSYSWTFAAIVPVTGVPVCPQRGTIIISNTPTCTLACTASAPSSGKAGDNLSFSATATPSNCTGNVGYLWSFGDGGTSSSQNPSHTYATAGTYTWSMTASVQGVTCSKSGSLTVTSGGGLPGDCDGSGSVSIAEVQKAINMFLGLQAAGCGADCNGDGMISIGEVQKVINAFLGLPSSC